MLRLVTLAAAVAAFAAPACAAESIHVQTAGKSADQVQAEVTKAAAYLCHHQWAGSIIAPDAQQRCIASTVRKTLAEGGFAALTTR